MTERHLAQFNIARSLYPLDDPRLVDFMDQLDAVNALAEGSPGFVWRLQTESGNATDIRAVDDGQLVVNMSVWRDVDSLFDYVYKTAHTNVMKRRREWFEQHVSAGQVLWWIDAGTTPTVEEGLERLEILRVQGPCEEAFTFKERF